MAARVARLARASGYFYFESGEAREWLDRTVPVSTVGSHSLEEWIAEYRRLKQLNGEIAGKGRPDGGPATRGH